MPTKFWDFSQLSGGDGDSLPDDPLRPGGDARPGPRFLVDVRVRCHTATLPPQPGTPGRPPDLAARQAERAGSSTPAVDGPDLIASGGGRVAAVIRNLGRKGLAEHSDTGGTRWNPRVWRRLRTLDGIEFEHHGR